MYLTPCLLQLTLFLSLDRRTKNSFAVVDGRACKEIVGHIFCRDRHDMLDRRLPATIMAGNVYYWRCVCLKHGSQAMANVI